MPALIGFFLAALTLPLWAGAIGSVIGFGFWLLIHYTVPFIVIGGALVLAACLV